MCAQGDAEAQCRLGGCLHDGIGIEPDGAQAVKWYTAAGERGCATALYMLGLCHELGDGVEADRDEVGAP